MRREQAMQKPVNDQSACTFELTKSTIPVIAVECQTKSKRLPKTWPLYIKYLEPVLQL